MPAWLTALAVSALAQGGTQASPAELAQMVRIEARLAALDERLGPIATRVGELAEVYVVEWSTAQGHEYDLLLRDGLSGRVAASVEVGPYDRAGRFVFVGYGPGVRELERRR